MKTIYFVLVFFLLSTLLYSTIINVPADQPSIQAGIDAAVDADTVLVQPGTYVENINYNGKLITVASLFLTTQDTTYISQTIVYGNDTGSVVDFESGEDSTTVLSGFTITSASGSGSGISCLNNSNPSLVNVTITGNSNYSGSVGGGGIFCSNSSPSLVNVTISGNSSSSIGGGIYCENSNPSLVNVIITGNSASGNVMYSGGGGISCWNSSPSLENVTISNNSASWGGGINCVSSSPILQNVTISGNTAGTGGGISCWNSSPSLVNVTILNNSASWGGGICCSSNSNPSLINCILWNDSPEEIYFYGDYDPSSITISYSDVQGGEAGIVTNNNGTVYWLEGNIDEDPLFVGTGNHPFSLLEASPCTDAGDPDPIYYDPEDPSNPGYALYPAMGTIINDMGAYGGPNTIGWPVVDIDDNVIVQTPEVFLQQNYPNPFNPTTTINYSLKENSKVSLNIYNIKGQKVKQLVSGQLSAGQHSAIWNGKDDNGKSVSSGIYFYKLKSENYEKTRKMILLR